MKVQTTKIAFYTNSSIKLIVFRCRRTRCWQIARFACIILSLFMSPWTS